ncbi:hypothetical protein [Rhodonellum sp.]|uniref:hypothetical protein n=1 Tax=Rhodonellum sp. TaxID=2231180 RepID=UPI00271F76F0|nr:hypothetical protein [Rhodonellum sp.]MDO9551599.1 hypothetical protein [Rhodonellum sp.]
MTTQSDSMYNKASLFLLFSLFVGTSAFAQSQKLDIKKLTYQGLKYQSSQKQIEKTLGEAFRVYVPEEECGVLANKNPEAQISTLDYGFISFTGNEKTKFMLSELNFLLNPKAVVVYENSPISNQTNKQELIDLFGLDPEVVKEKGLFFWLENKDAYVFQFEDEKLARISYWSPC